MQVVITAAEAAEAEKKPNRRPTDADITLRRREVWNLKVQGLTIAAIADKMGLAYRTIQTDLHQAAKLVDVTQWLESEVTLDLSRLEAIFRVYYAEALTGESIDAAKLCLDVLARKSKLLGLDAPKRVDIRHIIAEWAHQHGLDVDDVIDATAGLIPAPRNAA